MISPLCRTSDDGWQWIRRSGGKSPPSSSRWTATWLMRDASTSSHRRHRLSREELFYVKEAGQQQISAVRITWREKIIFNLVRIKLLINFYFFNFLHFASQFYSSCLEKIFLSILTGTILPVVCLCVASFYKKRKEKTVLNF